MDIFSIGDILKPVIRDGKIAIVLAKGYGAQWYTFHKVPELVIDSAIVNTVDSKEYEEEKASYAASIEAYCDLMYGERPVWGDTMELCVKWVREDTCYNIQIIDGIEEVIEGNLFEGELEYARA